MIRILGAREGKSDVERIRDIIWSMVVLVNAERH
jgi:hypothetical protein